VGIRRLPAVPADDEVWYSIVLVARPEWGDCHAAWHGTAWYGSFNSLCCAALQCICAAPGGVLPGDTGGGQRHIHTRRRGDERDCPQDHQGELARLAY
jgi:hypothetical protein